MIKGQDRQTLRRAIQFIILAVALLGVGALKLSLSGSDRGYFSFICPFYHLQSFFIWLSAGTGPKIQAVLIILGGIIVFTLVFGRLFCGWICPFGTILDIAGSVRSAQSKRTMTPFLADRNIKYAVLLGFTMAAFVFQRPIWCDICPAGAVYRFEAYLLESGGISPWLYAPMGILLVLILMAVIYDTRAFCKYYCPMGAFLSIVDRLSMKWSRVHIDLDGCIECGRCTEICPMGIDVAGETKMKGRSDVPPGECMRCYSCVDGCTVKNCKRPLKPDRVSPASADRIGKKELAA